MFLKFYYLDTGMNISSRFFETFDEQIGRNRNKSEAELKATLGSHASITANRMEWSVHCPLVVTLRNYNIVVQKISSPRLWGDDSILRLAWKSFQSTVTKQTKSEITETILKQ